MIDFEEELKKFKPSLDVSAVEDIISKSDISDMNDILMEMLKEQVKGWYEEKKKTGAGFKRIL